MSTDEPLRDYVDRSLAEFERKLGAFRAELEAIRPRRDGRVERLLGAVAQLQQEWYLRQLEIQHWLSTGEAPLSA